MQSLWYQTGRPITIRHKEHIRYIRNINPTSAYATHILDNRHEFGPAEETLKLLKPCTKGTKMNCWETFFMQVHHKQNILIPEQQVTDTNPLYDCAWPHWEKVTVTICAYTMVCTSSCRYS